jgi:hypothetical protein
MVHLVGFTIEIYYDAWPYERQILDVLSAASRSLGCIPSRLTIPVQQLPTG